MGRNLTNLAIQDTYEGLVQISGSQLTDGTGSLIASVDATASFATSASYATTASNVNIQQDTTDTNRFIPFVNTSLGTDTLRADGGLAYNPSTNTLNTNNLYILESAYITNDITASGVFKGDLEGNADTATSASYALTASYAENATTPNLQQVSDVGNTTTNSIKTNNGGFTATLTGVSLSSNRAGGQYTITGTTTTDGGLILKANDIGAEPRIFIDGATDSIYLSGSIESQNAISAPRIDLGGSGTNGVVNVYSTTDNEIFRATATGVQIGGLTTDYDLLHYGNTTQNGNINASGYAITASNFVGDLEGTASFAITASYAENAGAPFPYTGSADISGSLNLVGDADVFGNLVVGNTSNSATGTYAVSLAGQNNSATGQYSAVIGGDSGTNSQLRSVIVGGESNDISGGQANVALAGINNHITNGSYNVLGGSNNTANGGSINIILGWQQTMTNGTGYFMNGRSNVVDSNNSEVGAIIGSNGSRIGNGSNFLAQNFIGGGILNEIKGSDGSGRTWNSAIIGGSSNLLGANGVGLGAGYSIIAGGVGNSISGSTYTTSSAVIAGNNNQVLHNRSAVIAGSSLSTSKDDEVVVPNLTISGSVVGEVSALTITSTTASMDCSSGNFFTLTLANGVDTHLDATNIQVGQTINLKLTNNATSAGTISFAPDFRFEGGTAFTATPTTNAIDVMTFVSFDGTTLYATGLKNFS